MIFIVDSLGTRLLQAIQIAVGVIWKGEVEGSNSQATRPQRAHIEKQLTFYLVCM